MRNGNMVSRRAVLVGGLAAPALALMNRPAEAGINRAYTITVGRMDAVIFEGSAKKIVVTSLDKREVHVHDKTRERHHRIRQEPPFSKTIRPNHGLGGPRLLWARTLQGKTATLLVQVEQVYCNGPASVCNGSSISSQTVQELLSILNGRP